MKIWVDNTMLKCNSKHSENVIHADADKFLSIINKLENNIQPYIQLDKIGEGLKDVQ